MYISRPAVTPSPGISGMLNAKPCASLMPANILFARAITAGSCSESASRSAQGLSVMNIVAAFGLVGVRDEVEALEHHDVLDGRVREQGLLHPLDHLVGALQGGRVGQRDEADEVPLVLRGEEGGRRALEQPAGEHHHHEEGREQRLRDPEADVHDAASSRR